MNGPASPPRPGGGGRGCGDSGRLEAIILVGGRGTRLRPLTLTVPKPMLPVAGVPLLEHQLARAQAAGVRRLVFATSYRADTFEAAFGDGARLGLEIVYVTEEEPLGTAGAIRNAASALLSGSADPVLVLNGDIMSGHDIAAQLAAHEKAEAALTLHLTRVDDPRRYGSVPTDEHGRVGGFVEKSPEPITDQVNAGCYVFRRSVIDGIPAGRPVSAEYEIFPALLAEGATIAGYVDAAYWLDVGTPETFVQGSRDLVLGRVESPALGCRPGAALLLPGSSAAADAVVCGGTTVGAGSVVGPGARVEGSVLFDGVEVGSGASVRGSALARGVRVGDGAVLEGAVVGEGSVIGSGNELRNGARVWPGVELGPAAIRFSTDA